MKYGISFPFKAGQKVELRTFEDGYRGAWFRCEIQKIREENGRLEHESKYDDFPDEEVLWTSMHEENPHYKGNIKELMLRPSYPPIYNENQMPHVSEISEVTVIGGDSWRVGDLVDWWSHNCYWSGKITELSGDNDGQIELNPKPLGEGLSYNVLLKDLRPSLDWSPELGWTIPTPEDISGRPCARLVKPINQADQKASSVEHSHHAGQDTEAGSSAQSSNSADSNAKKSKTATKTKTSSSLGKRVPKKRKEKKERGPVNSNTRKTSLLSSDPVQNEAGPAAEIAEGEPNLDSSRSECTGSGGLVLHSKRSDLPEAAIIDLVEHLNKVKWLKKMMHCGISSSDAKGRPQWEFVKSPSK